MTSLPASASVPAYFVVSTKKLAIMTFFTFGWYWLFCFHRHWVHCRKAKGERIWPVARVCFLIFYLYPLMRRVEFDLQRVGVKHRWSPLGLFTLYLLSQLWIFFASSVLLEVPLAAGVMSLLGSYGLFIWVITRFQKVANVYQGDISGTANESLSFVNWLWMSYGLLIWPTAVFGMLLSLLGVFP